MTTTDVKKTGGVEQGGVTQADLAEINRLAKGELTAEQVYTFALRLCDNEVDRDFERFSVDSLQRLGELFVGKSGIFDHQWSAAGQTARIYRTEVAEEPGRMTMAGEPCRYLKGWAYMLRSEKNQALIEEIEGGIKKEVSVGCAVARRVCSVCGGEISQCGHMPGRQYDGKLCTAVLEDPTDAYEWSFVAVPAQREAGVLKKTMVCRNFSPEERLRLEKEAAMGRSYLASLRRELVRLAGLAEADLDCAIFARCAERMEEEELLELTRVLKKRVESPKWTGPQLAAFHGGDGGDAFLV